MIDSKPVVPVFASRPLPREVAVLLGLHEGDLRELESSRTFTVDVGLREDALAELSSDRGEVELRARCCQRRDDSTRRSTSGELRA